ncbi:regulatory protein, arsR family [Spirosomataceae bacterium TFI 002]|nr:regulatory protein, arsR family [Spirosomataceae bacterium TFI 002]
MDAIFKALNDPTRREILLMLKDKDLNAGKIAAQFNMSKPSISHHLDLLKQAELVSFEKAGQFINYSLNAKKLEEIFAWFVQFKPDEAVHLQKPKIRL